MWDFPAHILALLTLIIGRALTKTLAVAALVDTQPAELVPTTE